MRRRKRFRKRKHNRGSPSSHQRVDWEYVGRYMKIPGQDNWVKLSEWHRWFRYEGRYASPDDLS